MYCSFGNQVYHAMYTLRQYAELQPRNNTVILCYKIVKENELQFSIQSTRPLLFLKNSGCFVQFSEKYFEYINT